MRNSRMRTPPEGLASSVHPGTQDPGTCLSGCTLLASPSGGVLMRELRTGAYLLNAKGNRVRVTHVYFSRESSVMVQVSPNCHTVALSLTR